MLRQVKISQTVVHGLPVARKLHSGGPWPIYRFVAEDRRQRIHHIKHPYSFSLYFHCFVCIAIQVGVLRNEWSNADAIKKKDTAPSTVCYSCCNRQSRLKWHSTLETCIMRSGFFNQNVCKTVKKSKITFCANDKKDSNLKGWYTYCGKCVVL